MSYNHIIKYIKIIIVTYLISIIIRIYRKRKKPQDIYIISLVIFSKFWFLFAVVLYVFDLISDYFAIKFIKQNITACAVLLIFIAFLCALCILFSRWNICLNDKRIEFYRLLGKKNYCYLDKILKVEIDEKDNFYIYSETESVLKIPFKTDREYIITKLKQQGVCVKYKYDIDSFVMKLPLAYPVMYMCFFIVASLFTIHSICLNMLTGTLFWFVLALCLIYKTISDFLEIVIVDGNMIVQMGFLRKKREINYKQIISVIHREKNNTPYLYIYSEEGLKMKINMLCKNRKLMEELIKKHRWEY